MKILFHRTYRPCSCQCPPPPPKTLGARVFFRPSHNRTAHLCGSRIEIHHGPQGSSLIAYSR